MLEITQEKTEMIKQLLKKGLPPRNVIKMIHAEIIESNKELPLMLILFLMNDMFDIEIKYSNFQRMLHRMKPSDNNGSHSNDIYGNNVDDDDLI